MSTINSDTLLIDFIEDDWGSKFPDTLSVVNDIYPFYLDTTFTYNGNRTLRSAAISDNSSSKTTINFTLVRDGDIEFVYSVSSESNYDLLKITLDEVEVVNVSGAYDWTTFTQSLLAGQHTLVLEYTKDRSQKSGSDAGAIGYLKIKGVQPPFDSGYLIRANGKLFTLVDNGTSITPTELTETEVTSDVFKNYRFEFVPSSDVLLTFENPEVLYWQDSETHLPRLLATITAIPKNQSIISNAISLVHDSIKGIEKATVQCSGDITIALSNDSKATWQAFNGTEWLVLSDEYSGMSKSILEAITLDQWEQLVSNSTEMYIRVSLVGESQSIKEIYIDFAN